MRAKYIFLVSIFLAMPAAFVTAHSLYLFGISLDFDKELKSNVIGVAQDFLNTTREPLSFDLDKGLIMVHFEPDQRNYVEVSPIDFSVKGMRNENLKGSGGAKLTKEQGFGIANRFFQKLPNGIKSELKYDPEIPEVDGTYFYKWFRHAGGILVVDEQFMVNVDAASGNIIAWRLSIFDYPKESIDAAPAVSANVAKKVAELSFNVPSVENFRPYLIIYSREPVWVNRLQGQFYPFYIGVSAMDGSISFAGTLPGEVPKNYNAPDIKVVETAQIREIYK